MSGHECVQGLLARVAKGRVPEIVTQANGLGEVFVHSQCSGQGPPDLGHLQGVGQARAVIVTLRHDKDLGLVLEPAEGCGVDNPVPVALEGGAIVRFMIGEGTPSRVPAEHGIGGKGLLFDLFQVGASIEHAGRPPQCYK
jgi:hypothetical protein